MPVRKFTLGRESLFSSVAWAVSSREGTFNCSVIFSPSELLVELEKLVLNSDEVVIVSPEPQVSWVPWVPEDCELSMSIRTTCDRDPTSVMFSFDELPVKTASWFSCIRSTFSTSVREESLLDLFMKKVCEGATFSVTSSQSVSNISGVLLSVAPFRDPPFSLDDLSSTEKCKDISLFFLTQ